MGSAKEMQCVDDTYHFLFKVLKSRYKNKRQIVNARRKSLLTLKTTSYKSAEKLRMLADSVLKYVRTLKAVTHFNDYLLINIIFQNLENKL